MNEIEVIVRLLSAIATAEEKGGFNTAYVDERVVHAPPEIRDLMAIKAVKAGYLDGLHIVDNIDGQQKPHIFWEYSSPTVTLEGLAYLNENSAANKVKEEIRKTIVDVAVQLTTAALVNRK